MIYRVGLKLAISLETITYFYRRLIGDLFIYRGSSIFAILIEVGKIDTLSINDYLILEVKDG